MNIIPPQEMIDQTQPSHKKWWLWILIALAVIMVLWLGVAWLRGYFPFSYRNISSQLTPQGIINSLTATETPAAIPSPVLEDLSSTSSSSTPSTKSSQSAPAVPSSVLDSLSSKK